MVHLGMSTRSSQGLRRGDGWIREVLKGRKQKRHWVAQITAVLKQAELDASATAIGQRALANNFHKI